MLDVEDRSGVTVLRLRHGKVNALDLDLLRAITAAMRDVDGNKAVVITGTGSALGPSREERKRSARLDRGLRRLPAAMRDSGLSGTDEIQSRLRPLDASGLRSA
jgi:hypothetical protein